MQMPMDNETIAATEWQEELQHPYGRGCRASMATSTGACGRSQVFVRLWIDQPLKAKMGFWGRQV